MEDFISDDYEQRLLSTIDWQQFSGSRLSVFPKIIIISLFGFSFTL